MYLTISFPDGRRIEGCLLAATTEYIRLAIPHCDDTVELRRVEGYWMSEEGERVELESLIRIGPANPP